MSDNDNNVVPLRRGMGPDLTAAMLRGSDRQQSLLYLLDRAGEVGMTWGEVSVALGVHHGNASALLSHLHREKKIARLAFDRRERSSIYVMPEYVAGRKTVRPKRGSLLNHDMAAMLERLHTGCSHPEHMPHPTCKQCEIRELLIRYRRTNR